MNGKPKRDFSVVEPTDSFVSLDDLVSFSADMSGEPTPRPIAGRLRRAFLGVAPGRAIGSLTRGEAADPETRMRLTRVAQIVWQAYNVALEGSPFEVELFLRSLDPDLHGFASEGVAVAYLTRDRLRPDGPNLGHFLAGPSRRFAVYIHAGSGMCLGRARKTVAAYLDHFSEFAAPMVIDGFGFIWGVAAQRRS